MSSSPLTGKDYQAKLRLTICQFEVPLLVVTRRHIWEYGLSLFPNNGGSLFNTALSNIPNNTFAPLKFKLFEVCSLVAPMNLVLNTMRMALAGRVNQMKRF